ncbi:hypothetical protein [Streptomyces sp. NPDC005573]|uniref:hypothetical protein n=1 Tax=Streptomyces sp. NPDC005573 TaxID=3156890 RepID=UPI0033BEBB0A
MGLLSGAVPPVPQLVLKEVKSMRSLVLGALLTAGLALPATATAPASAAPTQAAPATYTHAEAARQFRAQHVSWSSTGRCDNRGDSSCTSFTGIRRTTVAGVIALKRASGCAVTVTAGTEKGHSRKGSYRHDNGYKVDLHPTACLNSYVRKHFRASGFRKDDHAALYRSPHSNTYAYEKSKKGVHWDVTYLNGSA